MLECSFTQGNQPIGCVGGDRGGEDRAGRGQMCHQAPGRAMEQSIVLQNDQCRSKLAQSCN